MSAGATFLLAHALLLPLGAGAAFHRSAVRLGVPARLAIAYGAGAVGLTGEGLLWSALKIRWTPATLFFPLFGASLLLAAVWRAGPGDGGLARAPRARWSGPSENGRPRMGLVLARLIVLASAAHLAASLATARSSSADYVLFWGVKAARFASKGGIDVELLRSRFFFHAVPDYPPLVPVVTAFAALCAGRMAWGAGLLVAVLWFLAAAAAVGSLRSRMSKESSAALTAFWAATLAISFSASFSGGNGEAPLVFFETAAAALLLGEVPGRAESRFLPALALCGASLTKVEGTVGALLIVVGVMARDRLRGGTGTWRRALPLLAGPAAALAAWFGFQASTGLRIGFRTHGGLDVGFRFLGTVVREGAGRLSGGSGWLCWLLPVAFAIGFGRRRMREALPGLVPGAGLLLFFLFDYLHDASDPTVRIGWTLSRISQPALSLTILACGVASFNSKDGESLPPTPADPDRERREDG